VQETVEKHGKIVLEKIKAQALQVQETAATLALAVANRKQKKAKAKKKWGTTRGEAKRIIDKMLFNYRRYLPFLCAGGAVTPLAGLYAEPRMHPSRRPHLTPTPARLYWTSCPALPCPARPVSA